MLDYQRIVDDVRNSLYTATVEGIDFIRAAAADYMVACDEANERLRHCGNLLKQGLRSEAIQFAEIEPVLLDVVATLDFPERSQWSESVARFGIVAPAPLMLDVAAELNEAYALEQPLSALLARHRLLALARSPIQLRISVLRRLAELDASNPVWHDDLAVFESERQKQLQQELSVAAQNGDVKALTAIDEELHQPWVQMPPAALLNWAAETRARIAKREARAEMERLVAVLDAAFSSFDITAGRDAREQWQHLSKTAALAENDPLAGQAAPALEWLTEQDEHDASEAGHQAAVSALEHALKQGRDRDTLEKLHRVAARGGYELSARLEKLYQARIAAFDQAVKRRSRIILVAIALTTCLLGSGMVVSGYLIVKTRQVAARVAALTKLINAGNFTEAHGFVARIAEENPGLSEDPQMASEIDRLKDSEQKDADHRQAFEAALGAVTAAGLDRPDDTALRRAEGLARSDADGARLLELRGKILATSSERRRLRESRFKDDVQQLTVRVTELEQSRDLNAAKRDAVIAAVRADIDAVDKTSAEVSQELRGQTKPLLARLDQLAISIRGERELHDVEQALTSAVGDRDHYRTALQAFITKFPTDVRSASFQRVMGEATLWREVDAWNEFVNRWEDDRRKPTDAEKAQALAKAIKSFCDEHPGWPRNDTLLQRLAYLAAISKRYETDQPLYESVDKLFKDPVVADVWMVELKNGRRYYSRIAPTLNSTGIVQFKYVTGFDLAEKSRGIKDVEVARRVESTQNSLAKQVTPVLAQLNGENWDASFNQLVDILLQQDSSDLKIDPLLKLMLLQQTLDIATKGSYCLECAYRQQLKMLKDSKVSAVANWLDPENAEANVSRPQAVRELEALRSVDGVRKVIAERQAVLQSPLGKRVQWIGLLKHAAGGDWQCATPTPPPIAGRLAVILANGDKMKLQDIGRATAQRLEVNTLGAAKAALLEGRPVYLDAP